MNLVLNEQESQSERSRSHLVLGWCLIAGFMIIGIGLEMMHGLKLGWYLDLSNETRRLLLRLAHAHGVLVGVLNICFAFTLSHWAGAALRRQRWLSSCFMAGSLMLPTGFLLGGLVVYGGDPNPAILLSPLGALLLLVGGIGAAWNLLRAPR